jgi:hypothetical protein
LWCMESQGRARDLGSVNANGFTCNIPLAMGIEFRATRPGIPLKKSLGYCCCGKPNAVSIPTILHATISRGGDCSASPRQDWRVYQFDGEVSKTVCLRKWVECGGSWIAVLPVVEVAALWEMWLAQDGVLAAQSNRLAISTT